MFWYQFSFSKGWVYCNNLQVASRCISDAGLCSDMTVYSKFASLLEMRIEYG